MLMAVKVIGLVVAGVWFVGWQLRDVAKAQEKTKTQHSESDDDVLTRRVPENQPGLKQ